MCHTGKVYRKIWGKGVGGIEVKWQLCKLANCKYYARITCTLLQSVCLKLLPKEERHEKCMENFAHYAPAKSTNET